VITEPVRVFAPGFGAGAVAGYAVMRVDPAVVAVQTTSQPHEHGEMPAPAPADETPSESASEGMREAFT
jgi:3-oxoacyl-[acyl-carrier-protein] synthase-3